MAVTAVESTENVHDHRIEPIEPIEPIERLAGELAAGGRVVPGISVDESGSVRSWWWPLPAARDRAAIASACGDGSA